MKSFLTIIAFFMISSLGIAQTNTFPASRNVGIGTTSPRARISFENVDNNNVDDISWYSPNPLLYGIHHTEGVWIGPNYQQLKLNWDSGIIINPGTDYGKSYLDVQGNGIRVSTG